MSTPCIQGRSLNGEKYKVKYIIMLRKTGFTPDNYYHIYNRGTDKREIFLNDSDYSRFIALLYICNNTKPVHIQWFTQERPLDEIFNIQRENILIDIGAYCLMPNHLHLLVKEKEGNGISQFMKKLSTAYAMYFNKKYERSGNLFQGRFKAELANTDEYLKYLFSYIHLNPIKLLEPDWKEKGIKDEKCAINFLNNYQWSSYRFYTDRKQKDPILDKNKFPDYFENIKEFKTFITEWLNYQINKDLFKVGP